MSGVLEAITYAFGQQLGALAGVRLGRLAQAAEPGDAELVLERTLGMDPSGTVVVDNITYTYGKLRDGALGELTVSTPQGVFTGVQAAHPLNTVVTDTTQNYSQLDLVRRALFVDTAEGPDLSALGRILGVLRQPAVADDAQYRKLIKAIAYNPRPTLYGLSTALDAMVGAGNYTIVEDPENYPCTVFVYISGTGLLTDEPEGKAYLSAEKPAARSGNTFTAEGPAVHLGALHLTPSSWWTTIGEQLPSLATADGAATMGSQLLTFARGDESKVTAYVLGPGCHAQRLGDAGLYSHPAALTDASTFDAGMLALVPDTTLLSDTDARGFALGVRIGTDIVGVGCVRQADGSVGVGLADLSQSGSGGLIAGTAATVKQNTLFEVHVSRGSKGQIRLYVDGRRVQGLSYVAAARTSGGGATGFAFGSLGQTSVAGRGAVKACGLSAETLTDWGSLYDTATAQALDALTFAQPLVAADVGRVVRVLSGGGAPDARGLYTIEAVNGQVAQVAGPSLGPVNVSGRELLCTQVSPPLTYPDDLGRTITLAGSVLGDDGTYTITALFEDGVQTALSGSSSAVACRQATLDRAVPQAESNLTAQLNPNLTPGAQAQVVLAGAGVVGDLTGALVPLTPRVVVPFPTAPFQVLVDELYSAHVYDSLEAVNHRLTDGPPPTYLLWPLYLTDPTHFVETYLDDMVAAGVTLKIVVGQEAA